MLNHSIACLERHYVDVDVVQIEEVVVGSCSVKSEEVVVCVLSVLP